MLDSIESWIIQDAFYIFESNRNVASGLGFGAVKGHISVKSMLDFYEGKHFVINGKIKMIPCPAGNTEALVTEYKDFKRNGLTQQIGQVQILSSSDYSLKAIHHGTATWVDGPKPSKRIYKETKLKSFFRDNVFFEFIEKYTGKKGVKLYTFLVYDFLELGMYYYIK